MTAASLLLLLHSDEHKQKKRPPFLWRLAAVWSVFSVTTQASPQTFSRGAVHQSLTWFEAGVCFRRAVAVNLPHVLPQHRATANQKKEAKSEECHYHTCRIAEYAEWVAVWVTGQLICQNNSRAASQWNSRGKRRCSAGVWEEEKKNE